MFSRGIVAAMEDEAQAAELAIDDAGSESMEAGLVDVVDMSADIETGTSEMAQTVSDADQLERHVEVLTDAEGEGGASPELVEATEIAVESIYARLGIYGATGIPALEAFSTKTGRARATRVAIEDISGKIKQIWEAVKAAFTKLVNFVKDFFGKLLDAKKKVMARITALEVKVKGLKGTPKSDKVKGSGIGKVFGADAEKAIPTFLNDKEVKVAGLTAAELLPTIELLIKGVESKGDFDSLTIETESGAVVPGSAPEGMQWTHVADFGTKEMIVLGSKTEQKGTPAYKAFSAVQYKVVKSSKVSEADSELSTLDVGTMGKFLSGSRSTIQNLMDGKVKEEAIKSELDKAIAGINRVIALAAKEDQELKGRADVARSAVVTTGNNAIKALALVNSETIRSVQAVLTYVERSVNSYSEEAKKDEKK